MANFHPSWWRKNLPYLHRETQTGKAKTFQISKLDSIQWVVKARDFKSTQKNPLPKWLTCNTHQMSKPCHKTFFTINCFKLHLYKHCRVFLINHMRIWKVGCWLSQLYSYNNRAMTAHLNIKALNFDC
jgi:hypothetical protein